jgi:hypothetical protein
MNPNFATQVTETNFTEIEPYRFANPTAKHTPNDHLGIAEIELNDAYTRIDFVYIAPKKYLNGGWIQIYPGCYIRPIGSNTRYKMLKAVNIPLAPNKYHFKSAGQVHHFSLFFPAVSKNVKQIDIIEKLAEGTYFNFFRVNLQHNEPTLVRIINEN